MQMQIPSNVSSRVLISAGLCRMPQLANSFLMQMQIHSNVSAAAAVAVALAGAAAAAIAGADNDKMSEG